MSVEVMTTTGWEKYSHEQFGLNRFGASGPYLKVYEVRVSSLVGAETNLRRIRIHSRGYHQARFGNG